MSNVAHVIFLTHDVSFSKSLSKALPDRVFRQFSIGDCSPEVAKRVVLQSLDADADGRQVGSEKSIPAQQRDDLGELDECIEILGGRLTDLEYLARRIKIGESPTSTCLPALVCFDLYEADSSLAEAIRQIVEQSASEILKMYLLDPDQSTRSWTPVQAWLLIKQLATTDSVSIHSSKLLLNFPPDQVPWLIDYVQLRYSEVLLSNIYKDNGESVLRALEQAELISIQSTHGRPHSIHPGKPVYTSAFRLLTEDHVLQSRLDLATFNELIKMENAGVEKCETELGILDKLPEKGGGVLDRVLWVMEKLKKSQRSIEEYEAESARLKKILRAEY